MSSPRPGRSRLPRGQRIAFLAVAAAGITGYAAYGVIRDDLVLPHFSGSHTATDRGPALHFHGVWALAMAVAMASVALAAVLLILEELRTPDGRKLNQTKATWLSATGFAAFLVLVTLAQFGVL